MTSSARPTPGAFGLQAWRHLYDELMIAKQSHLQLQKSSQADIATLQNELRAKQARVESFEQELAQLEDQMRNAAEERQRAEEALKKSEDTLAQVAVECRAKKNVILEKLQNELGQVSGLQGLQKQNASTVAVLKERLDLMESEMHKMQQTQLACEKLGAESASWQKKYDDKHKEWQQLFTMYQDLSDQHEQCQE